MYENSIKILGAYGTKAKGFGTTSFMLDAATVIDAGNLLNALAENSLHVEYIYLTHSHLDHIADIAYIVDNYFLQRRKTLHIIGLPQTIQALKKHFFNDIIWPDFSKIPLEGSEEMSIRYRDIHCNERYTLNKKTTIMPIETDHTVPSCGYIYKVNNKGVLITADTLSLENIINRLNNDREIKSLVIECSFPSSMEKLARVSKHLTPKLLFKALQKLQRDDIRLYINHIKPSYLKEITEEIEEFGRNFRPILLKDGDFINF
ncbi:3',5'-cyclic-nucleotide phosphodiesterase [Sulfurimonas sp. NW15]|uniref:MBL fold metallo-hydrolase n=1 Tax=Sulfurimonas sp. NW15 TaxID=2922729 RepID=UPI003DA88785